MCQDSHRVVHPSFQDPMFGLLNPDDYEKGLEEAWERAKPAGSTVTVKEKLAKLSKWLE